MKTKLMMVCLKLISGLWMTGKMPLNTPSGFIYGSKHNFEIIEQDNSFESKKIRNQNGENEKKRIATDTLIKGGKISSDKKGNNKRTKPAPQRSKWGISRKGEFITDSVYKN
jgi:hypothetical protein